MSCWPILFPQIRGTELNRAAADPMDRAAVELRRLVHVLGRDLARAVCAAGSGRRLARAGDRMTIADPPAIPGGVRGFWEGRTVADADPGDDRPVAAGAPDVGLIAGRCLQAEASPGHVHSPDAGAGRDALRLTARTRWDAVVPSVLAALSVAAKLPG